MLVSNASDHRGLVVETVSERHTPRRGEQMDRKKAPR